MALHQMLEEEWRLPGCGDLCRVAHMVLPGLTRGFVELHSPEQHEAYGRRLAGFVVAETDVLATGRLTIDMKTFDVAVDGKPVLLTPTEHRLLRTLAHRVGTTVRHEDLLSEAWAIPVEDRRFWKAHAHLVRVAISRIRLKLGPAETLIRTQPGVGYRLEVVEVGRSLPAAHRNPGWKRHITTWAKNWDRCRDCGTTERPHSGRGRCSQCRDRATSR